jgi:hypothetical protein
LHAYYSQTGCSFPRNIATLLSIKKYSLASSTLQVATESLKFLLVFRANCNFIAMFQVVVSYLESRFACFFTDKIKEVVPYSRNIPSERIRVAYKDINLSTNRGSDEGIFINISPGESLILQEAFRNAYDCGSESFKRVHIKINK